MKITRRGFVAATSAGFALGSQVAKDVSPLQNLFDTSRFEDFLSRHDPVWELPAKKWEQGLPLGNGDLGVMVWGSGNPLMFTLGKTDWWETRHWTPDPEHFKWRNFRRLIESKKLGSLRPPSSEEKAFQRPRGPNGEFTAARSGTPPPYATRLPVGRCELQPAGRIRTATMRLNLHTATGSGELTTDRGQIRWRCVVHAIQPLIIVELDSDVAEERAEFSVRSFSDARWGSPEIINTLKTWGYPAARESRTGPVNHWSQDTPVGGQCAVAWREYSLGKNRRVVFLAIVFTADSRQAVAKADQVVSSVSPEDLPSLVASHKRWWASYYPASFLSIPDTRLEALYWMEMYKLGAGTRPDKLPLAVTGPWSEDNRMSPWGGTYCYNINVQMIHWPIYTANRLDYGRSLYRMIDQSRPRLREFCRQFFEREGEFLSHTSDMHGNPTYDWAVAEFEFNGLCWVSHHYWLHWRYSQDREFLRKRCLPLMKEAVRVYLDELKEGADGRLHLPLGFSPEYRGRGESTWGPDPTIDLAMIRFVCGALLEGHRVLGTHDPEIPRWKMTLEKLAPYPEDNKEGLTVRADLPYEISHRHPSHLTPLYPLKLLTWEKDRELIERSLRHWIYQGHGEWVGFTFAWAACIAAHVSRAPLARTILLDYLDRYTTENSFNWGIHLTQVTPRCSMRPCGGLSTRPARVRGMLRQRRDLSRLSVRVALAGGFPLSAMRA